ncbi:MAG: aminotransferase class V-fold PLP-dependent enzyme, partial [Planctomycetales bacterium]|nr:aminotransferase class V-fold PLP-dependent enzyme [Planctomycetales bacterium]
IVHASNVTGTVQPIEAIAAASADHPALLLVDGAQTVGHWPVDVQQLGCDLLAAPGHKGLLGPTGTSFLYAAPQALEKLQPLRWGGTGTASDSDEPPRDAPAAYEAGNANVPGLLGLGAGIAYVAERSVKRIAAEAMSRVQELLAGLEDLSHVVVYGASIDDPQRVGVVSFNVQGFDPQEVAVLLDQMAGIQVRAGFHCAPRMHDALQTAELGGTVRVSFGPFNQTADVRRLLEVLSELGSA